MVLNKYFENPTENDYVLETGSAVALTLIAHWVSTPDPVKKPTVLWADANHPISTDTFIDIFLMAEQLEIPEIKNTMIMELLETFNKDTTGGESFSIDELRRIYRHTSPRNQLRKFAAHHFAFGKKGNYRAFRLQYLADARSYPAEFHSDVAAALMENVHEPKHRLGEYLYCAPLNRSVITSDS